MVWRVDRLGRSVPELVSTVLALREREVGFCSLICGIRTTSATGRFMLWRWRVWLRSSVR